MIIKRGERPRGRAEEIFIMQNVGMGSILTVGWLLLAAYLIVLLVLSFVIGAWGLLKSWLQAAAAWTPAVNFQGVDHS
jgi:protein-S-isoprenylcysteine O-methyltransferase Ste14